MQHSEQYAKSSNDRQWKITTILILTEYQQNSKYPQYGELIDDVDDEPRGNRLISFCRIPDKNAFAQSNMFLTWNPSHQIAVPYQKLSLRTQKELFYARAFLHFSSHINYLLPYFIFLDIADKWHIRLSLQLTSICQADSAAWNIGVHWIRK